MSPSPPLKKIIGRGISPSGKTIIRRIPIQLDFVISSYRES